MKLFSRLDNDIMKFSKKIYIDVDSYENQRLNDSYNLYNNSIDMIKNRCFTSAKNTLVAAYSINEEDEDISMLLALIYIKFGKFDDACDKFYRSYKNNIQLSKKYMNILISEEFKGFLEYYNLGIKEVNDENYEYAINIFNKIMNAESELIEPYVHLYLLYDLKNYKEKKDNFFNLIKNIDRDNEILNSLYEDVKDDIIEKSSEINLKENKLKIGYFLLPLVILLPLIIFNVKNDKENIKNKDEINKELDTQNKQEDNITQKEVVEEDNNVEIIKSLGLSREELLQRIKTLRNNDNNKEAIDVYKVLIDLTQNDEKMVSEYIYQIAYISEYINDYDQAIEYYKQYIDNYTVSYPYYDESYYNMSMIYYNTNKLDEAKKYLSQLIINDPDSIYNNSKVKDIMDMD